MSFRKVVVAVPARRAEPARRGVPARPAHHCGHGDVVVSHRGGSRTTASARRVIGG
ncbi:hypothetical protein [Streptomyces sp. NRRL S-337]|uniref:hypothetical protein n=1 Tax=Streptomyces sp. NRRL S-337 TaxID=1463900 RepID=UPI000A881194|nr:hypothetical protein [Streptomyces sp. NRRL S-337]